MPYLDLYCERLGSGLLAEPVNVLTNAAFFVVAGLLWHGSVRGRKPDFPIVLLLALVVAIGIGSSLFHTFATPWARLADELPILLFQLVYIWVYLRRVSTFSRAPAWLALVLYLALALYARQFSQLLNGSLVYVPALLATLALGIDHARRRRPERWALLQAAGVLFVAVVFRTLDASVCAQFPLGTHFLWHLLVGLVLYLCMRALIAACTRMDSWSVRAATSGSR